MSTGQSKSQSVGKTPSVVQTSQEDFKQLSAMRLAEAEVLFDAGRHYGCYYLAGYAVEFALKVVIIGNLAASGTYPTKQNADRYYGHDLNQLLELAKLTQAMEQDKVVEKSWAIAKDWSEQKRYERNWTEHEARQAATDLLKAVKDTVLPWIRRYW